MIDSPLHFDREAARVAKEQAILDKAANAHTTGEWFDIYVEIVENSVKDIFESNGMGADGLERLKERRPYWKRVREELVAHGMPISEDVECEGPLVQHDENGLPTLVSWPQGEWLKLHWKDGSMLEFRGVKAQVALGFFMWWENFHTTFKGLKDPTKQQSRIINPGTPEWLSYMRAKNRDQKQGLEP